ncbi:DNA mismatch repair endonuclease MutL [Mariprofundus ferrooxydans]|nr:DNA mismatch repair endonuclease MutL [Mariprofundus ferrooxydans]
MPNIEDVGEIMTENYIHILPAQVANQIAAGEVVERPASAVKELIENSVDAGATKITVRIVGAGKKRIEIDDNGCGMSAADAELALQRHATSKIETSEDLHCIASHGFRGEALPSIASVSRFRMQTCFKNSDEGIEVRVDGGAGTTVRPAPPRQGTKIEILDLFLNTPARLNFMRTDKTEEAAIVDVVRALALAHPKIAMRLEFDGRKRLDFPMQDEQARVLAIMGREFSENSVQQLIEHEGIHISAHLSLPTFHHRDSTRMMFLVNGRVIRDKALIAALRAGYRDVMFHDRYPVAVIRLEMDPADVDVNVHPAKREVRFKSPQVVRAGIVACVRAGIENMGQSVATTTTGKALGAMNPNMPNTSAYVSHSGMPQFRSAAMGANPGASQARSFSAPSANKSNPELQHLLFCAPHEVHESDASYDVGGVLDLGHAVAQVHSCYIVTETNQGIVLVDQHAAHERIQYEKLKAQLGKGAVSTQMLLTPVTFPLQGEQAAWLHDHVEKLQPFGVVVEVVDDESFLIRSVPAMLANESPQALVVELMEACMLMGADAEASDTGLGRVLERWLGNRACKGSIKAGRVLLPEEQENLLREMEKTPNIAQCNHGRPTYVRLSLHELDRLFGRKE